MLDLMGRLSALHRPRILIRAARIGSCDYRRERHLPRLLGCSRIPKSAEAVLQLIELEQHLNQRRLNNAPGYPLIRHVELLIALMGEAQLLSARRIDPTNSKAATDAGSRQDVFHPTGRSSKAL